MDVAVCFTNFGPYHLARLRALANALRQDGGRLIAYEVASKERLYPWQRTAGEEPFDWITFFPDQDLESLSPTACAGAIVGALDRDRPDAVGIVGYARPESMAAARWAKRHGVTSILMSESQSIDRPRVWWKEMVKRRRVRLFDGALVGGPAHRDYLIDLGMPADRIALGYNAVDTAFYRDRADAWRLDPTGRQGMPAAPFFLTVCRFAAEKNLLRLIEAFNRYRDQAGAGEPWDLVLCGDGPQADEISTAIAASPHSRAIHRPGFLQADGLARWYAHAGAFVLASTSEPWGLVVNEAASTGLPLLISERAGCSRTLVPDPEGTTGARFDPFDVEEITHQLTWLTLQSSDDRAAMGRRSAEVVSRWGPGRFAEGTLEAIERARTSRTARTPLFEGAR